MLNVAPQICVVTSSFSSSSSSFSGLLPVTGTSRGSLLPPTGRDEAVEDSADSSLLVASLIMEGENKREKKRDEKESYNEDNLCKLHNKNDNYLLTTYLAQKVFLFKKKKKGISTF